MFEGFVSVRAHETMQNVEERAQQARNTWDWKPQNSPFVPIQYQASNGEVQDDPIMWNSRLTSLHVAHNRAQRPDSRKKRPGSSEFRGHTPERLLHLEVQHPNGVKTQVPTDTVPAQLHVLPFL